MVRPITLVSAFAPIVFVAAAISPRQSAPTCVVSCIGSAAMTSGCATSDVECLCITPSFIDQAASCLASSCSAEDAAMGISYGEQFCASIGKTITIPSAASSIAASVTEGQADASATASAVSESATSGEASATSAASSAISAASSVASAAGSSASSIASASASAPSSAPSTPASGASTLAGSALLAFVGVGAAILL